MNTASKPLSIFALLYIQPLFAQAATGLETGTSLASLFFIFSLLLIVFHLPYLGMSFFYAVNGDSYSEKKSKSKNTILAVLALINCFIFAYPIFQGIYILPSLIFFIVPTIFFIIGKYKANKPLVTWLLSVFYVINTTLFALGGNQNYSGFGPKTGEHKTYYDANSKVLRSIENYSFGYRHGEHKEFYENGQLAALINFSNDSINGPVKEYYNNGQLRIDAFYRNNDVDGAYSSYYQNGNLESKRFFKDGFLNGEEMVYFENGNLSSHFYYNNGEKKGVCKEYYTTGQLQSFFVYNENPEECKTYYPNGQVKEVGLCQGEKKEGLWESYHDNGKLSSSGYYIMKDYSNSVKQGLWKTYYPNGQLKTTGEYEKGVRRGKWVKYFDDGQQSDEREY